MNTASLLRLARDTDTRSDSGPPDTELLRRYAASRDEAAFAEIVRRNGPVVLRACRHILGEGHADDAFQATFLLLARSAPRLSTAGSLAGWLHTAAVRIAQKARRGENRRRKREARHCAAPPTSDELSWREVREVLDAAIAALPEHYRLPVVLCCVQELSYEEAARRAGWTVGALRGRLERGKEKLRRRLARYGLPLAAPILVLGSPPPVSASLRESALAVVRSGVGGPVPPALARLLPMGRVRAALFAPAAAALAIAGTVLAWGGPINAPQNAEPPKVAKPADASPDGVVMRLGSDSLRHPDTLLHLRFSDDGGELISYGHGKVRRWDAKTGAAIRPANPPHDIATTFREALLSPDGTRLITPHADRNPTRFSVRDYDLATGRHTELFAIPQRTGFDGKPAYLGTERFVLSPDGTLLVEGHRHEAYLWDLGTKKVRHHLRLPGDRNFHFLFTPDGKHLVTAEGGERKVRFWDVTTGKETRTLQASESRVGATALSALAFSADGRWLAAVDNANLHKVGTQMALWDLTAPAAQPRTVAIADGFGFGTLAFGPGTLYAVAPSIEAGTGVVITRWDPATGKQLARWPVGIKDLTRPAVAVSPDGLTLAVGDTSGVIWLFDTRTGGEVVRPSSHPAAVVGVTFDPRDEIRTVGSDGSVMTWDAKSGREKVRRDSPVPLPPPGRAIHHVVSPDGRWALTYEVKEDNWSPPFPAALWDVSSGEARYRVKVSGWVRELIPVPGGDLLVARLGGGTADKFQAWDTGTGNSLPEINKAFPPYKAQYVALPDGKTFLACDDEQIVAFDLTTGREAFSWKPADHDVFGQPFKAEERLNLVHAVAAAPDGKTLAISIGGKAYVDASKRMYNLVLVEAATGKVLRRVRTPETLTGWLKFSPDGRWLAGGRCVWEVATLKEVRRFPEHPRATAAGFSPDGRQLVTGHANGTAVVWSVGTR